MKLARRVDPALVLELMTERTRDVCGQAEPFGLRRRSRKPQLPLVDRDADLLRRHEASVAQTAEVPQPPRSCIRSNSRINVFNIQAEPGFQSTTMMKTLSLLVAATTLSIATPSHADPAWDAAHPRRAQVNSRLANQNRRIDNGLADHQLTNSQARQLHREDRAIRAEERADAAAHGGHITRGEQRQINRQENRVSRQIHHERRAGK